MRTKCRAYTFLHFTCNVCVCVFGTLVFQSTRCWIVSHTPSSFTNGINNCKYYCVHSYIWRMCECVVVPVVYNARLVLAFLPSPSLGRCHCRPFQSVSIITEPKHSNSQLILLPLQSAIRMARSIRTAKIYTRCNCPALLSPLLFPNH